MTASDPSGNICVSVKTIIDGATSGSQPLRKMDRAVFGGLHLLELETTSRKLFQHLSSFRQIVKRKNDWGGAFVG